MISGMNVSGLQPVELQTAQLAAARAGLDSQDVRVLTSLRGGRDGVLAILAAPTLGVTPVHSCLAPLLTGDTPVQWLCPGSDSGPDDLGYAHVLVAAKLYDWKAEGAPAYALYLAGVARGDVRSVSLLIPGESPNTLYTRGETWGQFEAAVSSDGASEAVLKVYSDHGLPESLPLQLAPGEQGSFH
jgi:hypothetical protein